MTERLEISSDDADIRLDVFVSERLTDLSRSHVQKLIATHSIKINGQSAKANYKTRVGDVIDVAVPTARPLESASPENIPLDIIYEDADLIVINKAKGMVVHPAPGAETGTLVNALLAHCSDLSGIGGVMRPGIVHRLDKDTSGLIVVAKTDRAHISLSQQIRDRVATRKYKALLWGRVPFKQAVIDAPIMRHPVDRKRMTVYEDVDSAPSYPRRETDTRMPHKPAAGALDFDDLERPVPFDPFAGMVGASTLHPTGHPNARVAITELFLLEHLGIFSWVEAVLHTGRTHQIRVHCAFTGYPVVGDKVYGGLRRVSASDLRGNALHQLNEMVAGLHGQALHAYSLAFNHPVTGKRMEFTAPLPDEVAILLKALRGIGDEPESSSPNPNE